MTLALLLYVKQQVLQGRKQSCNGGSCSTEGPNMVRQFAPIHLQVRPSQHKWLLLTKPTKLVLSLKQLL
jgi:hypothetical protein